MAHAPGKRDMGEAIAAAHHLMLGHGLATQRLRAAATDGIELGVTLNLGNAIPASETKVAAPACRRRCSETR